MLYTAYHSWRNQNIKIGALDKTNAYINVHNNNKENILIILYLLLLKKEISVIINF